jgi:hypothetical protein
MRSGSQPAGLGPKRLGLLALAACTIWLVIQNTVLAVAMLWREPAVVGRVALTLLKAGALVTAKFWTSPAAAALVAVVLLLLLVRARAASPAREVRHG